MNDQVSLTIADYRHATSIQVRWGDLDALGHVNNAVYLTYTEQARISYFRDLDLWSGSTAETGLIMARVTMDFKLPLFADDQVRVLSRVSRMGSRSMDLQNLIVRTKNGADEIVTAATITVVVFDYEANTSTPIPADWRAKINAYEPAPVTQ